MSTTTETVLRPICAAPRLENVRYAIRDLAVLADEVAKSGKKILPLNIGDPLKFDFATPPHLIEAVYKAMRDGKNGYSASSGIPDALQAIRGEAERKGIRNVQDVCITSGVSELVDICLAALLGKGETVLTPSPEYPLYSAVLSKIEAPLCPYDLDESNGWAPDIEQIESKITPKTRGIVVINPNNPTGALYSKETLLKIIDLARRHNLVIFADEIYDKLVFDAKPHIPLASLASDITIVTFGGLSKSYLAPGWRVGWGIISGDAACSKPYVEGINKLLRSRLCASHPMQWAIKPALEGPQDHLKVVSEKLRRRRDITLEWVNRDPRVSCVSPEGAFYAFPKLDIPEDDFSFVKKLLSDKAVLVVHGSGFGQKPGTKHFRAVFLPDEDMLKKAYQAITDFMDEQYQ
ncbi:MAG TPA: aminotransferase class I/II-fold pyridoxal phosphate-dependent enzyme [Terriglobales bacterium]|nr:aminotransferase class I/II-fold pyridoxal phosphate-dependent enzyme [Terriglobales bacterium]